MLSTQADPNPFHVMIICQHFNSS